MRTITLLLIGLTALGITACASEEVEPCTPDCAGRICGTDGCGGSCGVCPDSGPACGSDGQCDCAPSCAGKECGSDGCQGTCGPGCTGTETCSATGQCVACIPDCGDRECGESDGCGGSCGTCPSNSSNALTCTQSGICKCDLTCTPNCTGRACGDDGCGGSCGACGAGSVCTYDRSSSPNWQCETFSGTSSRMNFFVSSLGNGDSGGDFGGLPGADALCQMLAEAAGVTGKTWRAYLSTGAVNARTRIGSGPWYNAWDAPIVSPACASSSPDCLTRLHTDGILAENVVTELGTQLDWANAHDIFTGSDQNGNNTGANCAGWTSSSENVNATVGHSYGQRAGASESWNSAHDTQCDRVGAQCTAGQSHVYCFAP